MFCLSPSSHQAFYCIPHELLCFKIGGVGSCVARLKTEIIAFFGKMQDHSYQFCWQTKYVKHFPSKNCVACIVNGGKKDPARIEQLGVLTHFLAPNSN